ncbi:MAG: hypothetical protein L6Q60_08855 [Rhodocyclaceae bacterium]|nr:hypothetical protein [Rhodocyclaceae bacterium]
MILIGNVPPPTQLSPARGVVLREFAPRTDRVPRDLRVDTPEIQESFRVSFSDAALAAASGSVRDAAQRPTVTDEGELGADPRLLAYRRIAAL